MSDFQKKSKSCEWKMVSLEVTEDCCWC